MHTLSSERACDEAEERWRAALRDAIRAHQGELADFYRTQILEVEAAREALRGA
jgi:hypothetical protein